MKKLLFLLFALLPVFAFTQQVKNAKTNETIDLKNAVTQYCCVILQPNLGKFAFCIVLNDLGFWQCVDEKQNIIEFKTIVAVMNYLHENGWEYINNIGGSAGAAPQYFFRKKQGS